MKTLHLKPRSGLIVPDPDRKDELPASGRIVVSSPYWYRRIHDGDVIVIKNTKKKETK